jgi:hypothetical protein
MFGPNVSSLSRKFVGLDVGEAVVLKVLAWVKALERHMQSRWMKAWQRLGL